MFATEFFVRFALKRGLGITRINANAHDAFLDQRMRILGSYNVVCPITANHQSPRVALQNTVRALKHILWPISWLLNHVAAQGHGKIQVVQQLGNHLDKVSDRTNFAELSYTRWTDSRGNCKSPRHSTQEQNMDKSLNWNTNNLWLGWEVLALN